MKQMIHGLNSTDLMNPCAIAPRIAAGRKATRHAEHKTPRCRIGEEPEREPPQPREVDRQQRQNCAELNQHRERFSEILVVESEEMLDQQQVAG